MGNKAYGLLCAAAVLRGNTSSSVSPRSSSRRGPTTLMVRERRAIPVRPLTSMGIVDIGLIKTICLLVLGDTMHSLLAGFFFHLVETSRRIELGGVGGWLLSACVPGGIVVGGMVGFINGNICNFSPSIVRWRALFGGISGFTGASDATIHVSAIAID